MNLDFKTVQTDGDFLIQRADVTANKYFWVQYKAVKENLKRVIILRREGDHWMAYRKIQKSSGLCQQFKTTYQISKTDKLYNYQVRAMQYLCDAVMRNGAAADGSDTGTGKTFVALGVCREFGFRPAVVCKKAGIAGWKRACSYMGVNPVFIMNWEQAKSGKYSFAPRIHDPYTGKYSYHWKLPKKVMVIFDEVHLANQYTSQNYSLYVASKGLPSLSLSATFADRPERLQSLFHVIGAMPIDKFKDWLVSTGTFTNAYGAEESIAAQQDMLELNKLLYPRFGYRVSYEDPEVKKHFAGRVLQTEVVSISTKNEQKQNMAYRAMMERVEKYRELGKQAEVLVADLRYRQMAELMKSDALAELAQEYMYEGKSVIIFVNFRDTLAYLSKLLKTRSLIYGEQEKDGVNREQVIADFQSGKSNLILSMVDAGGTSIDLHDLVGGHQRVSLVCPTYNPVTLQQILGRTDRAGSKSIPIIKLVYAANTVEEKVADSVNRKLDNIKALNDGDLMEPDTFKMGAKIT